MLFKEWYKKNCHSFLNLTIPTPKSFTQKNMFTKHIKKCNILNKCKHLEPKCHND